MFRVTFICDDRKLGDALRLLAGIAIGQPEIAPMINAAKVGGKLVAKSNGNMTAQFLAHLREKKIKEVTPNLCREFLRSIGSSSDSYSYLLKSAIDQGAVKKHKDKANQGYRYEVISK